ncbi:MAG: VCBS repeat-containing protein [Lysobacter sp.]|nr:VCBS repeat-containing protein [Lysobacter sp.]
MAALPALHNDLDGDGKSDLIWNTTFTRGTDYYLLSYWRMDGPARASAHNFQVGLGYYNLNTGDYDGDGRADIFFISTQAASQVRYNYIWRSTGSGQFTPAGPLVLQPNWHITPLPNGVDLNSDGTDDILLHNPVSGQGAYWLISNAAIVGGTDFDLTPPYTIVGAGDFDGDGRDDLLCADTQLGHLFLWRNRGDGGFDVSLIAVYDPTWIIAGNPDLNGDGHADIVWSNGPLNMLAFWWMQGASVLRADTHWAGPDPHVSTGDFDGDGLGDVVWTQLANPSYSFMWRSRGDGEFDAYLIGQVTEFWTSMR